MNLRKLHLASRERDRDDTPGLSKNSRHFPKTMVLFSHTIANTNEYTLLIKQIKWK